MPCSIELRPRDIENKVAFLCAWANEKKLHSDEYVSTSAHEKYLKLEGDYKSRGYKISDGICEYHEILLNTREDQYEKSLKQKLPQKTSEQTGHEIGVIHRKFSAETIKRIRTLHKEGISREKLAQIYKVSPWTISRIINNKRYNSLLILFLILGISMIHFL